MQLTIPRAYNYFSSAAISQNPNYYAQEIIPLLLTLISATLATWRRLLNMRYTLQQGYIRKMKLFVREKIKIIEEAEINLATVDRSGNLLPRKINRNANVVKRHRAVHEAQARKKVIQKSQVTVKVSSSNQDDDLLMPYKKVSFLPAYFFKVFIKKPKPPVVAVKKGAKPDPKAALLRGKDGKKLEIEQLADDSGIINLKTKKLMDQIKQDQQDYVQDGKIVVEKLHKTITKESKIGGVFNRFNMKKKRYVEQITELKAKNPTLKNFDEMEAMINSYEQILFHQHLFTDNEESHLTKLDMYYAN